MRGSVTVFFSLIFVTVLSVLGTTIESARWACARLYWKQAAGNSIRSVFADYCAPMFKEYGLLFVDKTYGEEEDVLNERFEEYLSYNMEPSKGSIYKRSFLYKGEVTNVEVTDMVLAIDGKGAVLRSSAFDYMKQRIPADLVEGFLEQFDFIGQADVIQDFFDKIQRIERDMEAVDEAVLNINSYIEEIRQLQDTIEQLAGEVNKLLKIEKPDDKIKKLLEQKKSELLDSKQTVAEKVGDVFEQSDIYETATKKVTEYLQNVADGWVDGLEVSQGIKDVIMSEIENLLVYSGGSEDVYGIRKNTSILIELTDKLKTWSQDYTSGRFEELDIVEVSLDWLKESAGEVTNRFDAEALWEQLKSEGAYVLLCPGYDKLSVATIEPFYNRAYTNYRSMLYAPEQSGVNTAVENIVFQEYMGQMFSNYVNPKKDTAIKYELEYIIGGKPVDKANIDVVINKLLVLREALNLLYIMCDSQKKEEAYSLALSCVGFTGVYAAVKALQYVILAVWALGEAMLDVRIIMSGGTVPIMKNASDWRLDFSELSEIGEVLTSQDISGGGSGIGDWGYEDYLKVFLYMEISDEQTLRAMDVMEADIQKNYSKDFRIVNCTYSVKMQADFELKPLFGKNEVFSKQTTMNFEYSY